MKTAFPKATGNCCGIKFSLNADEQHLCPNCNTLIVYAFSPYEEKYTVSYFKVCGE